NTFTDLTSGPVTSGGQIVSTMIYNNIAYGGWVASFATTANHATYDYTWYSRITGLSCFMVAAPHDNVSVPGADGCDTIRTSDDPFLNSMADTPENFRLRASIANYPGINVCAFVSCAGNNTFNRDAFGNQRGADGVWDRGAYEFVLPK